MSRVKGGVTAHKKRMNTLKKAKGYRFGRSKKFIEAKVALLHAGNHAFNDRRKKKAVFRQLWAVKLNAALRTLGTTYSRFIDALHKKEIKLNRKVLAEIAEKNPETFERIVTQSK